MTLQVQAGRIRLSRLGGLNFREQARWPSAPERCGMWAFPFGYDDPFFYAHQWVDMLPKRLRDMPLEADETLRAERDAWLRAARRRHPLRHFWYEGDLYCHLSPTGVLLSGSERTRMDAMRFAELLVDRGIDKIAYQGASAPRWPDADFLEVFLPRRRAPAGRNRSD